MKTVFISIKLLSVLFRQIMTLYEFSDIKVSKHRDHLSQHYGNKPFISVSVPLSLQQTLSNNSNNKIIDPKSSNPINIYSQIHINSFQDMNRIEVTATKNFNIKNWCLKR